VTGVLSLGNVLLVVVVVATRRVILKCLIHIVRSR
jgi:hypothetical protein